MIYRLFIISAMFIYLSGCSEKSPQAEVNSKPSKKATVTTGYTQQMEPIIVHYLQLKDALIAGDSKKATIASTAFGKAIGEFDILALGAENKQRWMIRSADLTAKGGMLITKRDIEAQRRAFHSLSMALIATLEDMGSSETKLYVQHCPMAFDNTGADWLSDSEKVVNPYFGDAMLHCGTVKETLNR